MTATRVCGLGELVQDVEQREIARAIKLANSSGVGVGVARAQHLVDAVEHRPQHQIDQ